jgi:hypothetical protein
MHALVLNSSTTCYACRQIRPDLLGGVVRGEAGDGINARSDIVGCGIEPVADIAARFDQQRLKSHIN